jgi:surface protein
MAAIFLGAKRFTANLSSWDVSKVTSVMESTFEGWKKVCFYSALGKQIRSRCYCWMSLFGIRNVSKSRYGVATIEVGVVASATLRIDDACLPSY